MSRISNAAQNYYMSRLMADIRTELSRSQVQVSSGKKALNFSQLGATESTLSISMRQDSRRVDTYVRNLDLLSNRLDIMVDRMEKATDMARDVYNSVMQPPTSEPPDLTILRDKASQALAMIEEIVNTNVGGRYLFGASDTGTRPLNDMDTLKAGVDAVMSDYMAGIIGGADVVANVDSMSDAQLGFSITLAGADNVSMLVEKSYALDYTYKGNEDGFQDLVKGLRLLASAEYDPMQHDEYTALAAGATGLLQEGALRLDRDLASLGVKQQIVEDMRSRHAETQVDLATYIGRTEDVDMAVAATRMQVLQTQIQVSYKALTTLRDFSLINYL